MNTDAPKHNNKNIFENMLSGGHPNSLGRTLEVVDDVLNNKDKLADLFQCSLGLWMRPSA